MNTSQCLRQIEPSLVFIEPLRHISETYLNNGQNIKMKMKLNKPRAVQLLRKVQ